MNILSEPLLNENVLSNIFFFTIIFHLFRTHINLLCAIFDYTNSIHLIFNLILNIFD